MANPPGKFCPYGDARWAPFEGTRSAWMGVAAVAVRGGAARRESLPAPVACSVHRARCPTAPGRRGDPRQPGAAGKGLRLARRAGGRAVGDDDSLASRRLEIALANEVPGRAARSGARRLHRRRPPASSRPGTMPSGAARLAIAPRLALARVDLAQIEHLALRHAPIGKTPVLDQVPVLVGLAVLHASAAAQEHALHSTKHLAPSQGPKSSLQAIRRSHPIRINHLRQPNSPNRSKATASWERRASDNGGCVVAEAVPERLISGSDGTVA